MILALITAVLLPREQTDVSGRSLLPQYDFSSSFPTLHFSLLQTWFSAPTRWMWTSLSWLIPCLSGLPAPAGWLSSSLSPLHTIWWSMAMRSASGHETLQRLNLHHGALNRHSFNTVCEHWFKKWVFKVFTTCLAPSCAKTEYEVNRLVSGS